MRVEYDSGSPAAPRSGLGPYRADDYFRLPGEPRCELVFGRLLVTPAQSFRHQEVVLAIAERLAAHARLVGARAVPAPLDVELAPHSVVQPDVVYVAAEQAHIVRDRVEGPPVLVVEVLSPGTARRDLGEKLKLYAEAGVAEYWIVDPAAQTFEFLVNRDGGFSVGLPEEGRYRSPAVAGLELDLEAFWRDLHGPQPES